jgi:hypothetical protein
MLAIYYNYVSTNYEVLLNAWQAPSLHLATSFYTRQISFLASVQGTIEGLQVCHIRTESGTADPSSSLQI